MQEPKNSKKQRILAVLSDGQPHRSDELIPITHRFSATIADLRAEGHRIDTIPLSHNRYAYQMYQPDTLLVN